MIRSSNMTEIQKLTLQQNFAQWMRGKLFKHKCIGDSADECRRDATNLPQTSCMKAIKFTFAGSVDPCALQSIQQFLHNARDIDLELELT